MSYLAETEAANKTHFTLSLYIGESLPGTESDHFTSYHTQTEKIRKRAGQEPVAKQIERRKWGWIRHFLRKPASSTTRQALTWNPQGTRGWPRNSWRRDTEAELKQQGTNWSGMIRAAQNRVRGRGVADGLCSTLLLLLY